MIVERRKWSGDERCSYDAHVVADDEHGLWLWAPTGTPATVWDRPIELAHDHLRCVPRGTWWSALSLHPHPYDWDIYVDVAAPAEFEDGIVRLLDLDLDVVRAPSGVRVLDEDEFEHHRMLFAYPDHVVARALTATEELTAMLQERVEPFGEVWESRLASARALAGAIDGSVQWRST